MPECWGCTVRPHEAEKCERLSGGTWDRHHVLPQSVLRKEFPGGVVVCETKYPRHEDRPTERTEIELRGATLKELLGDDRNMVWMRRFHHFGLEGRVGLRCHFEQIPAPAVEFARELGQEHRLRQLYPPLLDVVSGAVPSTGPEFEEALRLLSELAVTPASDVEGDVMRDERWEP